MLREDWLARDCYLLIQIKNFRNLARRGRFLASWERIVVKVISNLGMQLSQANPTSTRYCRSQPIAPYNNTHYCPLSAKPQERVSRSSRPRKLRASGTRVAGLWWFTRWAT